MVATMLPYGLFQQPQKMHLNDMVTELVLGDNYPVRVFQRKMGAEFLGHPTFTGVAMTWNECVGEEAVEL